MKYRTCIIPSKQFYSLEHFRECLFYSGSHLDCKHFSLKHNLSSSTFGFSGSRSVGTQAQLVYRE